MGDKVGFRYQIPGLESIIMLEVAIDLLEIRAEGETRGWGRVVRARVLSDSHQFVWFRLEHGCDSRFYARSHAAL